MAWLKRSVNSDLSLLLVVTCLVHDGMHHQVVVSIDWSLFSYHLLHLLLLYPCLLLLFLPIFLLVLLLLPILLLFLHLRRYFFNKIFFLENRLFLLHLLLVLRIIKFLDFSPSISFLPFFMRLFFLLRFLGFDLFTWRFVGIEVCLVLAKVKDMRIVFIIHFLIEDIPFDLMRIKHIFLFFFNFIFTLHRLIGDSNDVFIVLVLHKLLLASVLSIYII